MRPVVHACLILALSSPLARAQIERTTLVLHAAEGIVPCEYPQQKGLDCEAVLPTVDLTGIRSPVIFLYLANHGGDIDGVYCAFDWPAEWMLIGGSWNCQRARVQSLTPRGPGPDQGALAVTFDPLVDGELIPIGRMLFARPGAGCLSIIESRKFGVSVTLGDKWTPIPPENRGRVCVGSGGRDACLPAGPTLSAATWGTVKSQYLFP